MPIINGVDLPWNDYNAALNNAGLGNAPRNPDGTVATVDQRPFDGTNAVGQQQQQQGARPGGGGDAPFRAAETGQALEPGKYYRNPAHGHVYQWDGNRFLPVVNDPQVLAAVAPLVAGTVNAGWGPEWHGSREVGLGEIQTQVQQSQQRPPQGQGAQGGQGSQGGQGGNAQLANAARQFNFVRSPDGRVFRLNPDGSVGAYVQTPGEITGPILEGREPGILAAIQSAFAGSGGSPTPPSTGGQPGGAPPPAQTAPTPTAPTVPGTPAGATTGAGTSEKRLFEGPGAQYGSALRPGDQTFFGPVIGDGENGLPLGFGQAWHELRLKAILDLIGADGQMRDPVTGQVLQGQQTLAAIKQAADIADRRSAMMGRDESGANTLERDISEGTLTGRYGDQNTLARDTFEEGQRQFNVSESGYLDYGGTGAGTGTQRTLGRERFEEDRSQQLYNRAANPASVFENELARSSGASVYDPITGGVNVGQAPTQVAPVAPVAPMGPAQMPAQGSTFYPQVIDPATGRNQFGPTQANTAQPAGTFRVPAIIQAYRQGAVTPRAGNINATSTTTTPQAAVLGERDIRLANQRTLMSPDQRTMVKSFARAGGVTDNQFDYLEELNKPRTSSVHPLFSGR